jgi:hypothetical protein
MPDVPIGPELTRMLALEGVPPVTTARWNSKRKAQVVRAVQEGLFHEDKACRLYHLTGEELAGWQQALAESGERGLCVTKRIHPGWIHRLEGDGALHTSASMYGDDRHVQVH